MTELPKGWRIATLEEVAEDINKRVDDPSNSGYERFVGLEHFQSGELTIKKWGSTQDVESSMKIFQKGDLLFARRNAYLKRASMVDFDGVCSGDAFVLRQKPEILVENYLPLIFNTESLWDYAISHAAGSMSKRVKWRDLKEYEFPLPPIEEQRKIAEFLWAVEDTINKSEDANRITEKFRKILFHKLSFSGEKTNLGSLIKEREEVSRPPHSLDKYVGLEHIESGSLKLTKYKDSMNVKSVSSIFYPGDLLYGKLRPNLDKSVISNFQGICSGEILVLQSNKKTLNEYLLHLFHSKQFIQYNTHLAYGTKMPRTSFDIISKYSFYLPSLNEQKRILGIIFKIVTIEQKLHDSISNLKRLKKFLVNKYLNCERKI